MIFSKKKIHIIELNRIYAVVLNQMSQNRNSTFRRFHFFFVAICSMNTAKAAIERTADARMVNCSPLAEEGGTQVLFHWEAMKWRPRKRIGAFHQPLLISLAQAKHVFVGKSFHRVKAAVTAKCINKFEERVFTLSTNNVIDVTSIE